MRHSVSMKLKLTVKNDNFAVIFPDVDRHVRHHKTLLFEEIG